MRNEALGTDYEAAVKRAEMVLLPAFDAWLKGDTARHCASARRCRNTGLVIR